MERTRVGSESGVLRAARGLALLVAATVLVAACSSGGGATSGPITAAPVSAAPGTAAPATGGATGALSLLVRTDPTLGDVVVGKDGMSLYVFKKDITPGTSACVDKCADSWPALTVADMSGVKAGPGVTGALGTITRADGKLQVTLGGAPLYYFVVDAAPGDTKGQGLNDVWYVASPAGTPVTASGSAATKAPGASTCSGPTCY